MPPGQRWHHALLHRLEKALDNPGDSQADQRPAEGDGAHGRSLHGGRDRHLGWLPPVYQRGLHRGDDRRRAGPV